MAGVRNHEASPGPRSVATRPRTWILVLALALLAACTPPSPAELPASDTTVEITTAEVTKIELVLTFLGQSTSSEAGIARVAVLQTVNTEVLLDLGSRAALYWMASVLKNGELSPNQATRIFTGNSDEFRLHVTETIDVTHDPTGWGIPAYDESMYTVNVGFGLSIGGWVWWAYSVLCAPKQSVTVDADSYVLVRWNGQEQIGDPVQTEGMASWSMPIGHDYLLAFDASGNGVLSERPGE